MDEEIRNNREPGNTPNASAAPEAKDTATPPVTSPTSPQPAGEPTMARAEAGVFEIAVLPLQSYGERGPGFVGAAGVRIAPGGLSLAGRVAHEAPERGQLPIERSFVVGDRLYTLSWLGIASSGLGDLATLRYTAF